LQIGIDLPGRVIETSLSFWEDQYNLKNENESPRAHIAKKLGFF
jgi:hypothetical protein